MTGEQPAVCTQPDCGQLAGHDNGFHAVTREAGRRDDLLVVWGSDRAAARMAAFDLELDMRRVFCVGNQDADSLRGLAATRALVLPGADSATVEYQLAFAVAASGLPWLDLRGMGA